MNKLRLNEIIKNGIINILFYCYSLKQFKNKFRKPQRTIYRICSTERVLFWCWSYRSKSTRLKKNSTFSILKVEINSRALRVESWFEIETNGSTTNDVRVHGGGGTRGGEWEVTRGDSLTRSLYIIVVVYCVVRITITIIIIIVVAMHCGLCEGVCLSNAASLRVFRKNAISRARDGTRIYNLKTVRADRRVKCVNLWRTFKRPGPEACARQYKYTRVRMF